MGQTPHRVGRALFSLILLISVGITTLPVGAASDTTLTESHNWAGYAADVPNVTLIHAAWTVPAVAVTPEDAYSAAWVGIGGSSTDDLIQAGTAQYVEDGVAKYFAWVELLPATARQVSTSRLAVRPGDAVGVTISNESGDTWIVKIENATSGQQVSLQTTYTSCRCSADWIVETPYIRRSGQRALAPLANFERVRFSDLYAVVDGVRRTPAELGVGAIRLSARTGAILARPGALGADGMSFAVTYG